MIFGVVLQERTPRRPPDGPKRIEDGPLHAAATALRISAIEVPVVLGLVWRTPTNTARRELVVRAKAHFTWLRLRSRRCKATSACECQRTTEVSGSRIGRSQTRYRFRSQAITSDQGLVPSLTKTTTDQPSGPTRTKEGK